MTPVLVVALVVLVVLRLRRRARRRRSLLSPLAGMDTGTRSPFRAPRGVRFHRGF